MELYRHIDLRNHPARKLRAELFSSTPTDLMEARVWYRADQKVPYMRCNELNLPLIAKDDNFHDAPAVNPGHNDDEFLFWSNNAESLYQFGKYRKVTFANLKSVLGTLGGGFRKIYGSAGTMFEPSGDGELYITPLHAYMETRAIPGEKKLQVEFKAQQAARFFAGPTSGANATPVFRQILMSDLPEEVGGGSVTGVLHVSSEILPDTALYKDGDQWINPANLDKFQLYDSGTKKVWVEIHAP